MGTELGIPFYFIIIFIFIIDLKNALPNLDSRFRTTLLSHSRKNLKKKKKKKEEEEEKKKRMCQQSPEKLV